MSSRETCATSDEVTQKEKRTKTKKHRSSIVTARYERFVEYLYRPADPACLGVVRALFGICMVLDIVEERGFADIDLKWGDPWDCHFPLIHGMRPPPLPWTILIYTLMWMGAFGIALGLCFKLACACFVIPYWYFFLLDKSYWNNHTYLYGIVSTLFWCTSANNCFALDASIKRRKRRGKIEDDTVPQWNYLVLKFQFLILYFLAGLKKSDSEWLDGYSMRNLSRHWIFDPFKLFLSEEKIDFLVVHWFAFIFDLTIGFWMIFDSTRFPAMIFCATFHFMNSRLFAIGMFPYVCLATMPLFCNVDWPRNFGMWILRNLKISSETNLINCTPRQAAETLDGRSAPSVRENSKKVGLLEETLRTSNEQVDSNVDADQEILENQNPSTKESTKSNMEKLASDSRTADKKVPIKKPTKKQKFVVSLLLLHVFLQLFLPYSHFLTKGYNNWVSGLYGYSWNMMVHAWDTVLVVIKIRDNENNNEFYIDSEAWVQNDRWVRHGDMARQYAFCLKENILRKKEEILSTETCLPEKYKWMNISTNMSVYFDVWCSLNDRFQQRVYDPNVDMLSVDWHPLKPITYTMPLLTQYNSYRERKDDIERHVYTWSNYTDVLFVADFPGLHLDNFINNTFTNVSLTVLEGEVTYQEEEGSEITVVRKGGTIPIKTGIFHKVRTTSAYPACYMYTYVNEEMRRSDMNGFREDELANERINNMPILKELNYKIKAWMQTTSHIANAFFHLLYGVPMIRRVRIKK